MAAPRLILVIGMHRSGTSAITKGLSALGVELGSRLQPGIEGVNDKGFFEDIDFSELNAHLLQALGHDWHTLSPVGDTELAGTTAQSFRPRALDLLRRKLAGKTVLGIKDPRFARVLPFWQSIFEEMSIATGYVIACRNPLSVAQSLAKRDRFDPLKSHYLWLEHMLASMVRTVGSPRLVIDFDRLVDNPVEQLRRIAACHDLAFDAGSDPVLGYKSDFLEPGLRHARHTPDDLYADPSVPDSVCRLYGLLAETTADRCGTDSGHILSACQRMSRDYSNLHAPQASSTSTSEFSGQPRSRLIESHVHRLDTQLLEAHRKIGLIQLQASESEARYQAIRSSAYWRATYPLRLLARRYPRFGLALKRGIQWAWWCATLQVTEKYRQYRNSTTTRIHCAPPVDDHAIALPLAYAPQQPDSSPSIAVICHLYFETLAIEFKRYLANIGYRFDLFITTDTSNKRQFIEQAFNGWSNGRVEVRIAPNRGRDIAPKLITCGDVYTRYDYVLHIHSKKSTHFKALAGWREYLLESLLGTPDVVAGVFEIFRQLPCIGMIAPQHYEEVRPALGWGGNFDIAASLATRLGMTLNIGDPIDFPSGSMFWARSAALRPLLDASLSVEDFPLENGQRDVTLAHAIERLYFHVCEAAGYNWLKVGRGHLVNETARRLVNIDSLEQLNAYQRTHNVRLIGTPHAPRHGIQR